MANTHNVQVTVLDYNLCFNRGFICIDKGYRSNDMFMDREGMEISLLDPFILITNKRISKIGEILPILAVIPDANKTGRRDLLVIAEDVEGEALTYISDYASPFFNIAAVRAPSYGDRRKDILQDIAILSGGTIVSENSGFQLKETTVNMLGHANSAKITKDNTMILGGKGNPAAIKARIDQILSAIKNAYSDYDREKLTERLNMITYTEANGNCLYQESENSKANVRSEEKNKYAFISYSSQNQ